MGDVSHNFSREEFACSCGCGFDAVDVELLEVLEDVRDQFNTPIRINSGCRCESHNKAVGGSSNSQHIKGKAVDFIVIGANQTDVAVYLENIYPNKYGVGRYNGRTHIDVRNNKARWRG